MKELSTEEKAKRYVEALDKAKKVHKYSSDLAEIKRMENIFPELIESEDEKIRKSLLEYLHTLPNHYAHSGVCVPEWLAWLEKQGNSSKECLNLPHFTFDDVLALQCCMATVKKVQEDKELYEQLQNLHNRLHDAYWLEKQGEQKPIEEYNITGISSKHADGKLGEMIKNMESANKVEPKDYSSIDPHYFKSADKIEKQPSQWNISDYRTWQYIVSDVLTKHDGIGQYLDDGLCKRIAKYMQENWSKKLKEE